MNTWQVDGELAGMVSLQGGLEARVLTSRGVWKPTGVELSADETELLFHVPAKFEVTPVQKWGWKEVADTREMFAEFTAIHTPGQARYFAERYGPIFICHEHRNMAVPAFCRWTGYVGSRLKGCSWQPRESVDTWLKCVRQANAALQLITKLQLDQPLYKEAEAWRDLMFIPAGDEDKDALWLWLTSGQAEQAAKRELMFWLNGFPMDTWPFRLMLDEQRSLRIDTGLGFLPIVWMVVAEAAAGGKSVQVCSGCGKPYLRRAGKRAPKVSQKNFCEDCGELAGYSLTKKQSRRKRTAELRELAAFVAELSDAVHVSVRNMDELRNRWNNKHPAAAFHSCADLEKELRLLFRGTYNVIQDFRETDLIATLEELGFQIEPVR